MHGRCRSSGYRGTALLCATWSPQPHCLLPAFLAQTIVSVISGPESCCRPQTTSSRRFHEAGFTLQTDRGEPSVLFVKSAHVNTVLQTTSVQMGAGFHHSMFVAHRCISSSMLMKVPPVSSHQSPDADFHLSGSHGVQFKSINVATTQDMGPRTRLHRFFAPRSLEWTRLHAFCTGRACRCFRHRSGATRRKCKGALVWILVLAHSNFDCGDWTKLVPADFRARRCCGSDLLQVCR